MSPDSRHEPVLIPGTLPSQSRLKGVVRHFIGLVLVGVLIGLACLPLNLVDGVQDHLYALMPTSADEGWSWRGVVVAFLPLVVMPILLLLQRGPWQAGAGSGIPSTMNGLEDPSQLPKAMAAPGTVQRGVLWSIATIAMFPLGREGPVVQFGAAVSRACHRRFRNWLPSLSERQIVAIGGGAGLAGGFNTPLLGAVFMLEELTADYSIVTIWPALVISVAAAGFSNIGGEPMFGLGVLNVALPEVEQLMLAFPIGIVCGLVGGFFNKGLVWLTGRLAPVIKRKPLRTGLYLGGGLTVLALLSWGTSTSDGEALVRQLIEQGMPNAMGDDQVYISGLTSIWITLVRVIGPMLALSPGVPGGLIDPSLTFGAVLGYTICAVAGISSQVGIGLGLAAGLSGATQLPLVSIVFAWRLAGDQQLFAGVVLASVLAAYTGRLVCRDPVYHGLSKLQRAPRR
ncbi:H(+)/Cl(-) exchange transporter ClcA [Synechococcus sp. MIT S9509]|uniref:chloride channel protein n=1 Tax=unclassified Synechococcus TaxID=2626047 RepID=UPI0007BBD282|nr:MULTISPECIES: chloride channel protein [unclassified Synechococcus]KZR88052.1 H(+)/Cl(-) exchange transporter ClcA [Synechococcus sp. MIT S9504]KZR92163.1 H(+)/Cl(-) exchange transporter ClcA [Synechococcus sp. MIT S9509]